MVLTVFEHQSEIGGQERRAQLGNELFLGVADIAEALLLETAIQP